MEINVLKDDLQIIREIIYEGREKYNTRRKDVQFGYQYKYQKKNFNIGTKLIVKINNALKKIYGHDCEGKDYLKSMKRLGCNRIK